MGAFHLLDDERGGEGGIPASQSPPAPCLRRFLKQMKHTLIK